MKVESVERTAEIEGRRDEFSRPLHGLANSVGLFSQH